MPLLISDFPATELITATDLRPVLVQLNKLCRRSSAAVAKQIEVHVEALWDTLDATETSTAPDATVAATVNLLALYSDFTDYSRAVRVKVGRASSISSAAVVAAIVVQLRYFLTHRGWTFV
jgi:hypothetical protein